MLNSPGDHLRQFAFKSVHSFLPRDAMHSADCCRKMSVCPSYAGILSKRLNVSLNFFHPRVAIAIPRVAIAIPF